MRFPTREADVAALAGNVIVGLTESADDFPAPPVAAADLKVALDGYLATRDKASIADGAAAEAHGEKDEALEALIDSLRADLRYAEDFDFLVRALGTGEFAVLDDGLYVHRLGHTLGKYLRNKMSAWRTLTDVGRSHPMRLAGRTGEMALRATGVTAVHLLGNEGSYLKRRYDPLTDDERAAIDAAARNGI